MMFLTNRATNRVSIRYRMSMDSSYEEATRNSLAFHCNTANIHPDHDTITAFRKQFMEQLNLLSLQNNMLTLVRGFWRFLLTGKPQPSSAIESACFESPCKSLTLRPTVSSIRSCRMASCGHTFPGLQLSSSSQ
jgi:hypothetical protein